VLGLDLSPGMLATIRERAPGAALLNADAAALPLRDAAADLSLAMHMLYTCPTRGRPRVSCAA
jgi:ubiquinone/menaquinone biosynthesis C-methylase UbiE